MRAREVLKLKTGDVITCRECPENGCEGGEYTVTVETLGCGCNNFSHSDNSFTFYSISCGGHDFVESRWNLDAKGYDLTGRSIKLIKRAGE